MVIKKHEQTRERGRVNVPLFIATLLPFPRPKFVPSNIESSPEIGIPPTGTEFAQQT